jgi:hypothetical protein
MARGGCGFRESQNRMTSFMNSPYAMITIERGVLRLPNRMMEYEH